MWSVADLAEKIAHVSVDEESSRRAATLRGCMLACPSWHFAMKFIAAVAFKCVGYERHVSRKGVVSM